MLDPDGRASKSPVVCIHGRDKPLGGWLRAADTDRREAGGCGSFMYQSLDKTAALQRQQVIESRAVIPPAYIQLHLPSSPLPRPPTTSRCAHLRCASRNSSSNIRILLSKPSSIQADCSCIPDQRSFSQFLYSWMKTERPLFWPRVMRLAIISGVSLDSMAMGMVISCGRKEDVAHLRDKTADLPGLGLQGRP
jgi:hypothetical protein